MPLVPTSPILAVPFAPMVERYVGCSNAPLPKLHRLRRWHHRLRRRHRLVSPSVLHPKVVPSRGPAMSSVERALPLPNVGPAPTIHHVPKIANVKPPPVYAPVGITMVHPAPSKPTVQIASIRRMEEFKVLGRVKLRPLAVLVNRCTNVCYPPTNHRRLRRPAPPIRPAINLRQLPRLHRL